MKQIFLSATFLTSLIFASCNSKNDVDKSTTLESEKTELPEQPLVSEDDIVDSSQTENMYSVIDKNGAQKQVKLDSNEQLISANELPINAQSLISQSFGNVKILHSIKEKERTTSKFKIQLEEGTKLEFAENGEWIEVKNELNKPIPIKFIPSTIINYLDKNYPKTGIEKIERDQKEIKVDLLPTNSPDLVFDLNGNFIKKD